MSTTNISPQRLRVLALTGTLGIFVLVQWLVWMRAGAVFEYPLDDVYIHLAMARQIAHLGYGVNSGEAASASSSILYPFLLAPFAAQEFQRFLPLIWNALAITASGLLWAQILIESRPQSARMAAVLALLAPLAMNLAVVAASGMENALHASVTLALVLGLVRFNVEGRIGVMLMAAILIGPMLRYEALAPSMAACAVLALSRRAMHAAALAMVCMAIPVMVGLVMWQHGLPALPNSVLAKASLGDGNLIAKVLRNSLLWPGAYLVILSGLAVGLGWASGRSSSVLLGLAAAAVCLSHLPVANSGLLGRYENYAIAFGIATCAHLTLIQSRRWLDLVLVGLLIAPLCVYQYGFSARGQYATRATHLQQAQMARFAHDYAPVPVAVNDIGRVTWGSKAYVLDLWGLALRPALKARLDAKGPGWADALVAGRDVQLAMIYDNWLVPFPGTGWRKLGALVHEGPGGYLGGLRVSFYAVGDADDAELRAAFHRFAATLPDGVHAEFAEPHLQEDGQ